MKPHAARRLLAAMHGGRHGARRDRSRRRAILSEPPDQTGRAVPGRRPARHHRPAGRRPISSRLGQTVVIDNRPGAGATIGTRAVANAEPDGYTLLFASTTSLSIGPALFKNLDYDPVKSFAPVASVSIGSMVVAVSASVPAKTLQELVAYAKANPGKLHNGAGVASPPHIAWGLFTITTGTRHRVRPLSRHGPGHDRPGGGPDPDDDRRHRLAAAPHSRRQGAGAGRHRHRPAAPIFPTCRP